VEAPESDGREDDELSEEYWKGFIARNQSIIVDLMYGQLKSTVRCLECHNISINFDPFLTLSLPISRPTKFVVGIVPFEVFRNAYNDDDSEEDPDYKVASNYVQSEHLVFHFEIDSNTIVGDIKKQVIDNVVKIGSREIRPENLQLGIIKWGEMISYYEDSDKVEPIDQSGANVLTCFIETQPK
jgi:hypothetical protein